MSSIAAHSKDAAVAFAAGRVAALEELCHALMELPGAASVALVLLNQLPSTLERLQHEGVDPPTVAGFASIRADLERHLARVRSDEASDAGAQNKDG